MPPLAFGAVASPWPIATLSRPLPTPLRTTRAAPRARRARVCSCAQRGNKSERTDSDAVPYDTAQYDSTQYGQKYAHLPADERAEMIALDQLASGWIGTSIARWEWWELIKSRRERLRTHAKRHEQELSTQLDDLRTVLMQLDTLLGVGLVERDSERISVMGWAMVLAASCANFILAYSAFELVSNTLGAVLPAAPF